MKMAILKTYLISIFLSGSITAMESIPGNFYYNASNLAAIDRWNLEKHMPCMILIDESQFETVNSSVTEFPITILLALSLIKKSFPIIVSGSIFKNLLQRITPDFAGKSEDNKFLAETMSSHISKLHWELYDIPHSQFILLLPKSFLSIYGAHVGFKKLPNISNLLETKSTNDYSALINWIEKNKKSIRFNPQQFTQVFIPKNESPSMIWDFFIMGHGSHYGPLIADLSQNQINSLLAFFDTYIKTGALYMISCTSGGENKTLLETQKDGTQINHNFIFILGSISDSTVTESAALIFERLIKFFNTAGMINGKIISINDLLLNVTHVWLIEKSPHGSKSIPQIWLPGGIGFQTWNLNSYVLSLNKTFAKRYEENKQPLSINNKLVILLYPTFINFPLIVSPWTYRPDVQLPKQTWANMPLIFEPSFFKNFNPQMQHELVNELKTEGVLPPSLMNLPELITEKSSKNPNNYLYPEFISMSLTTHVHIFPDIVVKSELECQGVLQFMREAFLDVQPQYYSQTFLIDKLTGKNDISLTLAAVRLLNKNLEKQPLEELLKEYINKDITLENVMITYKYLLKEAVISFQINGTTWSYTQDLTTPTDTKKWWQFERKEYDYAKDYAEIKADLKRRSMAPEQKSISEVLKKKQAEIIKKKAEEQQKIRSKL